MTADTPARKGQKVNQQSNGLISHIRRLSDAHFAARQEDALLIDRFVQNHDEAAFQALMTRHGPMVLRVCRRILAHDQDAEDAFQAVFLLLSRKAGSLRDRGSVGPWLYGVASRLARKARTAARRRSVHEARAVPRGQPAADPSLAETQAVLEEEMGLLPEKYRAVLVLCYVQGLTRDRAAEHLGLSLAGIKKRLERGRELLQNRLKRRGFTLSALLFGMLMAGEGLAAVPHILAADTYRLAVAVATGKSLAAAGARVRVIEFFRGGLSQMFVSKMKTVAIGSLATIAIVLSAGLGLSNLSAGPKPAPARIANALAFAPAPKPSEPAREKEKEAGQTVPVGVPLDLRLVGKNAFPLDLKGMTPEKFRERLKPGPVLPGMPQVNLHLEVTNTGDKPLKLVVGGSANHLTLDLQGPNTVVLPAIQRRLPRPALQPGREITVAPGKTVTLLEIPQLSFNSPKGTKLAYWTEAGEYTLDAEYTVFVSPAPADAPAQEDGSGVVTLKTPKFKFKVEAPENKQLPEAATRK